MTNKKRSKLENVESTGPPTGIRGNNNQHTPKNHHNVYMKVSDMKHTMYTVYTGKFQVTSRRGHKYLIIMCELDSNTILSETMKTKNEKEIIFTYQTSLNRLN